MVDADEALSIGLVDRVCPATEVYEQAVDRARTFARGPFALRLAKQAIDQGGEMDLESALRLETTLFTECFATDDRRIGMRSFVENGPGKAEFSGS
jgi:enoyl-CoA hydratase